MVNNGGTANTLTQYLDQLYLGMLSLQPDPFIQGFVDKYLPYLNQQVGETGGWTIYPPEFNTPPFFTVNNSFVFTTHPYFTEKFTSGQLSITQKVYADEKRNDSLTDIRLWLEFDNIADAKNAYQQLLDTFSGFETLKRITTKPDYKKAEFTDKTSTVYYNCLQIVLVKDALAGKKWAIPKEDGFDYRIEPGYKILIDKENDLS